ncbi:MAG: hypothetical protein WA837_08725, partial [Xanthobacteraceae bacterium]
VGYLLGNAHIAAFRSTDLTALSAAESVALRFPLEWKDATLATGSLLRIAAMKVHAPRSAAAAGTSTNARAAEFAMFSPQPTTVPQAGLDMTSQATFQTASAEDTLPASQMSALSQAAPSGLQPATQPTMRPAMSLSTPSQMPAQKSSPAAAQPAPAPKVAAAPHRPVNDRAGAGYMLNDTQIASIKERLHLTPDQEQMWPAVEAALRNIAYARAQQARGRGAPVSGETQAAAIDPNAVQGLKSAAVPLILSFNSEQKEEVRNLAHVMGLDQLATQF